MTPEQARDLFSDAFEAELDAEQQQAFDQALAANDALRAEYEAFQRAMQAVQGVPSATAPNLLPGVQTRIFKRTRGKYYAQGRNRLSHGLIHPVALGVFMLALIGFGWLALRLLDAMLGSP
jgi:anti-sigma factor RsiW